MPDGSEALNFVHLNFLADEIRMSLTAPRDDFNLSADAISS